MTSVREAFHFVGLLEVVSDRAVVPRHVSRAVQRVRRGSVKGRTKILGGFGFGAGEIGIE